MWRGLVPAGGEAWPVVEIDDAGGSVLGDNAITTVYVDIQNLGRLVTNLFQCLQVEMDTFGRSVNLLESELAVVHARRVEPVEETCSGYSVEFHQVAHQMLIDDGVGNAADSVFLQDAFGLFRIAHIGDVLAVNRVEVASRLLG